MKNKPSRYWYLVAVAVLVLGVAGFMLALRVEQRRLAAEVRDMPRIMLPQGGAVELPSPGTYTLFYEGDPATGIDAASRVMPEAAMVVTRQAAEADAEAQAEQLEVKPSPRVTAYNFDEHDGYAVFEFSAPAAGTYDIRGSLVETPDKPFVIAVGRLDVVATMSNPFGIFGAAVLLAFGFVIASVLGIVTYILRNKGLAEKRMKTG